MKIRFNEDHITRHLVSYTDLNLDLSSDTQANVNSTIFPVKNCSYMYLLKGFIHLNPVLIIQKGIF